MGSDTVTIFHGVPAGDNATMPDMTWRDRAVMAPLLILIIFLGILVKPGLISKPLRFQTPEGSTIH